MIEKSLKGTLETLQDMQDFVDTALAEGYGMGSKFTQKDGRVFVKLVKAPRVLPAKDKEPRDKTYCAKCRQTVPVESTEDMESNSADPKTYLIYSDHSINPKHGLVPSKCLNSLAAVPLDAHLVK